MYYLHPVKEDKKRYLPLLLEADPDEASIDGYLDPGMLYVMEVGGLEVAEAVVVPGPEGICEVKSLAVAAPERRKGHGSLMMENLFFLMAPQYRAMRVAVAPGLNRFFERLGFAAVDAAYLERPLKVGCACCEKEKKDAIDI